MVRIRTQLRNLLSSGLVALSVITVLCGLFVMGMPQMVSADATTGNCRFYSQVDTNDYDVPVIHLCSTFGLDTKAANVKVVQAAFKAKPKSCFIVHYRNQLKIHRATYDTPEEVSCSTITDCAALNATGSYPNCTTVWCDTDGGNTVTAPGGDITRCQYCSTGKPAPNNDATKCSAAGANNQSGINAGSLPLIQAGPSVIPRLLNIFFGIVGAIALLVVSIGGLRYVLANGDPNAVAQAKNTILYALVGLVVAITGFAIVTFVIRNVG